MIKRLLLLTLFCLHATSQCDFDFKKLQNALQPFKKELQCIIGGTAVTGASLLAGGYFWGASRSDAALKKKQFDIEHAKQEKIEHDRIEKVRLEEKEKKDKEEALKAAALKKKEAELFAISITKEYVDETKLLERGTSDDEHQNIHCRIILSKHNHKPFNSYDQRLDANARTLEQFKDILDKPQFEYLENLLKGVRRTFNFFFAKYQHEEAMTAQKEKNAADIKRIEIEHAQLQNNKLRAEEEAQIETKKAMKSFSDHNRRLQETSQEIHIACKQIASTVNSYRNAVNDNTRTHEANHQRMALQLQNRETMLDRKFEAQAVEVAKLNTQLTEVLVPLKQLAKIAEEAKSATQVAQAQSKAVTGHPAPVTSTSSTTTSSVPTTAEQTPPPSFVGDSIAFNSIPAIPVPTQPQGIQPIPVPTTR